MLHRIIDRFILGKLNLYYINFHWDIPTIRDFCTDLEGNIIFKLITYCFNPFLHKSLRRQFLSSH